MDEKIFKEFEIINAEIDIYIDEEEYEKVRKLYDIVYNIRQFHPVLTSI